MDGGCRALKAVAAAAAKKRRIDGACTDGGRSELVVVVGRRRSKRRTRCNPTISEPRLLILTHSCALRPNKHQAPLQLCACQASCLLQTRDSSISWARVPLRSELRAPLALLLRFRSRGTSAARPTGQCPAPVGHSIPTTPVYPAYDVRAFRSRGLSHGPSAWPAEEAEGETTIGQCAVPPESAGAPERWSSGWDNSRSALHPSAHNTFVYLRPKTRMSRSDEWLQSTVIDHLVSCRTAYSIPRVARRQTGVANETARDGIHRASSIEHRSCICASAHDGNGNAVLTPSNVPNTAPMLYTSPPRRTSDAPHILHPSHPSHPSRVASGSALCRRTDTAAKTQLPLLPQRERASERESLSQPSIPCDSSTRQRTKRPAASQTVPYLSTRNSFESCSTPCRPLPLSLPLCVCVCVSSFRILGVLPRSDLVGFC